MAHPAQDFVDAHAARIWDETLERVTGERLTPKYFAEQFVND